MLRGIGRSGITGTLLVAAASLAVSQQPVAGTFSGTVADIDDDWAVGQAPNVQVGDPFTATFSYSACSTSYTEAGDALVYFFGDRELRMTVTIGTLTWAIENSPFTGEVAAARSSTIDRFSVVADAGEDDSYILRFPNAIDGDLELHVLRLDLGDDQTPLDLLAGQHLPTGSADVDFGAATSPGATIASWDIIDDTHWIVSLDVDQFTISGPSLVQHYCQANPNSTGLAARIGIEGTLGVTGNMTALRALDAPPATFGLFFYGDQQAQTPLGDGFLCVGGSGSGILRLTPAVKTDPSGAARRPLDFLRLPPAGQILAGSTWNFQFWYRDALGSGGTGSNLTAGLQVTFCP